jgi:hypothetical protein
MAKSPKTDNRKAPKKQRDWGAIKLYGATAVAMVAIIAGAAFSRINADRWIDAVKVFDYKGATHLAEDITYKEIPAVGGDHFAAWQNCGFYDVPVRNEHAVHSMEHGAVWLTYRPGLPADQVAELAGYVQRSPYVLVSPVAGQTDDVVATAWNRQLVMDGAGDDRIALFVSEFASGPQTPEPGAPCWSGVGTPK